MQLLKYKWVFQTLCFITLSPFAFAKPSTTPSIKTVPIVIQKKICDELSVRKPDCGKDHPIQYSPVFKLDNHKNLFFFAIKKTSLIRRIPVTIDSDGNWKVGSLFEGEPQKIVRDNKGGNWMQLQSYNEGTTPSLYYSRDGIKWDYVRLPENRQRGIDFEVVNRFCYFDNKLLITLEAEFSGVKPKVISSWKAELPKLLGSMRKKNAPVPEKKSKPVWQPVDNKTASQLKCQMISEKNNTWLIQDGETMTLFQHEGKNLTVKVDHEIILKNSKIEQNKIEKIKKNYAIQVGAYRSKPLATELVQALQKAGFKTFTQVLTINHQKVNKIYVGPFLNSEVAKKRLALLKAKFSTNKPVQSAFVLKYRP